MRIEAVVAGKDGFYRKALVEWEQCVAIGYAGRNQESVRAHVEELKALGVPAPSKVPSMYWIDPTMVSSAHELSVIGEECSGEVEFFAAFDCNGEMFFTVASDHTDRKLETVSVSKAKQGCSKIIGEIFWKFSDVEDHWDDILLRSWVAQPGEGERIYQDGKLSMLLPPSKLYELAREDAPRKGSIAYLSGTIPLGGKICYTGEFIMELSDPVLGRSIKHSYNTIQLPDRN